MPGKQNEPNETEARRERMSWIRLVQLTWKVSLKIKQKDPLFAMFDNLELLPSSHPIFDIIYHFIKIEAAMQTLIDEFEFDAIHIATIRDIVHRTIGRG